MKNNYPEKVNTSKDVDIIYNLIRHDNNNIFIEWDNYYDITEESPKKIFIKWNNYWKIQSYSDVYIDGDNHADIYSIHWGIIVKRTNTWDIKTTHNNIAIVGDNSWYLNTIHWYVGVFGKNSGNIEVSQDKIILISDKNFLNQNPDWKSVNESDFVYYFINNIDKSVDDWESMELKYPKDKFGRNNLTNSPLSIIVGNLKEKFYKLFSPKVELIESNDLNKGQLVESKDPKFEYFIKNINKDILEKFEIIYWDNSQDINAVHENIIILWNNNAVVEMVHGIIIVLWDNNGHIISVHNKIIVSGKNRWQIWSVHSNIFLGWKIDYNKIKTRDRKQIHEFDESILEDINSLIEYQK